MLALKGVEGKRQALAVENELIYASTSKSISGADQGQLVLRSIS